MEPEKKPVNDPIRLGRSDLERLLVESPFHRVLGIELEKTDDELDQLTLRLPFSAAIARTPCAAQHHGGVIASLIDIAGDFALVWLLGHGVPTINFRTDFLSPASDTDLIATAQVRRLGRSIAVCDIDVHSEDGKLVALGRGTYATAAG